MDGVPLEVNRSSIIQLTHNCKNIEMTLVGPIVLTVVNKVLGIGETIDVSDIIPYSIVFV